MQDIRQSDNPNAVAPAPGTCAGRLPWPGLPTIFGETRVARTDRGSTVSVFVPRTEYALRFRYFCHGCALGTFQLHGYTPYSGRPMMTVLNDEWQRVGNPTVGDIAVWFEAGGQHAGMPFHSARVEVWAGGDTPMQSANPPMILSSKNGPNPLETRARLDQIDVAYTSGATPEIRFYTRRSGGVSLPYLPE